MSPLTEQMAGSPFGARLDHVEGQRGSFDTTTGDTPAPDVAHLPPTRMNATGLLIAVLRLEQHPDNGWNEIEATTFVPSESVP
jgi:hypothetical protein